MTVRGIPEIRSVHFTRVPRETGRNGRRRRRCRGFLAVERNSDDDGNDDDKVDEKNEDRMNMTK